MPVERMENYQPPQPVFSPGSRPPVLPPQQSFKPEMPRRNHDGIKSVITTILILLIAPILAICITTFGFQSYEVDGPSMEPTLYTHERLIIWKVGRTWSRITKNEYIPPRGTVIVFIKRGLYDFSNNQEKQLIKRIIALPGERVTVQNGVITVYNDAFPQGFNPDKTMDYGLEINTETEGNVDLTVEAGHVFVVGDHRNNSLDSRVFGPVPVSDIVGTLSVRILPLKEIKKF
jgi:signal peptidase I